MFKELATLLGIPLFQLLLFFLTFIYLMWMCAQVMYVNRSLAACRGQKAALDPLELVTNSCELPDVGLATSGSLTAEPPLQHPSCIFS